MSRGRKVVPPTRQILKNINLCFFPGARIGLLGVNGSGSGTSMLLENISGLDTEIYGEANPCRA